MEGIEVLVMSRRRRSPKEESDETNSINGSERRNELTGAVKITICLFHEALGKKAYIKKLKFPQ